jgi:hypothetical protein
VIWSPPNKRIEQTPRERYARVKVELGLWLVAKGVKTPHTSAGLAV